MLVSQTSGLFGEIGANITLQFLSQTQNAKIKNQSKTHKRYSLALNKGSLCKGILFHLKTNVSLCELISNMAIAVDWDLTNQNDH